MQNWYMQIGSDQQTSELFYEALMSEQALSNKEEFQFIMMFHGIFLALQNSYLQAEEGTLHAEILDGLAGVVIGVKDLPGMKRYWRQRKGYLHSGFVDYVDQLLKQEKSVTVDIYRTSEAEPENK